MRWPRGATGTGVASGIKRDGELDLGLLVTERPAAWAGTFTQNAAAAPAVHWSKSLRDRRVRAVIANSGNANACTGRQGKDAVATTAQSVARALECESQEVLIASTGPIGVQLPLDKLVTAVPSALQGLTSDISPFSQAILTTDTTAKTSSCNVGDSSIVGVAKGAAMLAPNMATMLAFLVTDARIDEDLLQESLNTAVSRSFNRVCVDACSSTNDSVFLLSTGATGPVDDVLFAKGLQQVCGDLAEQMVKDAEGATRVLRIKVRGARDESSGLALGQAVAASVLWRAAVHGADPNWGRVLAALGAADRSLDLSSLELWIGDVAVFMHGEPVSSLQSAAQHMQSPDVLVTCVVGEAPTVVEVLSSDISPNYVTLNAVGTT